MATVRVTLRTTKLNKSGEAPLCFRITSNRKSNYVSLGLRIDPKYWNESRQQVKPSYPNATRLNNFLKKKIAQVHTETLILEAENEDITPEDVRYIVTGKKKKHKNAEFFSIGERYIKEMKLQNRIGSSRRYKACLDKLARYNKSRNLPLSKITVRYLKDYKLYMMEECDNKPNTIHSNFRIIRRIINLAIEEDLFPLVKNPFLKMKLKRQKVERTYLTEEELDRLLELELTKGSWRELARNTFVFASYCAGLRMSDVFLLKWKHFNGTHINKTTKKTKTPVSIKLPQKVKMILALYQQEDSTKEDFIFPLMKNPKRYNPENAESVFKAISNANAQINTELAKIAQLANFDKHLSFHISRHTFATLALRKGMRIEYVSKLMGHSSIKTTQVYTKIVNEELDKAMDIFDDEEE